MSRFSGVFQSLKIVQCTQSFTHRRRIGRIEKGKFVNPRKLQSRHLQYDTSQRDPADLRICLRHCPFLVGLSVKMDTQSRSGTAAPSTALPDGGLRNHFKLQLFNAAAGIVTLDPGKSGVDTTADIGDGQRGLCHIGAQYDPAQFPRMKYLLLIGVAQSAVKLKNFDATVISSRKHVRCIPDLPLSRQKNESIAPESFAQICFHAPCHKFREFFIFFRDQIDVIYRKCASFDVDNGGIVKKLREGSCIKSR